MGVARVGTTPTEIVVRGVPMDEAISVGSAVFHRHRIAPIERGDQPCLTLHSYQFGAVTLGTISYSRGVRVETGTVRSAYQINLSPDGSLRTRRGPQSIVASPRLAAAYGLHQHEFEGFTRPQRMLGLKIERTALERRLEHMLGRSLHGSPIEFDLGLSLDGADSRDWYTVVQLFGRRLWGSPGLSADSSVMTNLHDALLSGLLLSARHSFSEELARPIGPAAPRAVRRAVDAVDAHPGAARLTVPELADIAGVSVRALQAGFRATLDTTPLAYLRERRLTWAHRDLEAAAPDDTNVAAVADRWGFAHHGRFSSDYRQRFGEHPSATLRRP